MTARSKQNRTHTQLHNNNIINILIITNITPSPRKDRMQTQVTTAARHVHSKSAAEPEQKRTASDAAKSMGVSSVNCTITTDSGLLSAPATALEMASIAGFTATALVATLLVTNTYGIFVALPTELLRF